MWVEPKPVEEERKRLKQGRSTLTSGKNRKKAAMPPIFQGREKLKDNRQKVFGGYPRIGGEKVRKLTSLGER